MEWLTQNWFFLLLAVAFVGLHLFGHGHGGHGGRQHAGHGGGGESRYDKSSAPAGRGPGEERSGHGRHGNC